MKHNFWKGLVIYIAAYTLMLAMAHILLGSVVYSLPEWPTDMLIVFIPLYLIPAGYSLTQTDDDVRFEYSKDVADGFLLAFLGHYMGFWWCLGTFILICAIHRVIAGAIQSSKETNQ